MLDASNEKHRRAMPRPEPTHRAWEGPAFPTWQYRERWPRRVVDAPSLSRPMPALAEEEAHDCSPPVAHPSSRLRSMACRSPGRDDARRSWRGSDPHRSARRTALERSRLRHAVAWQAGADARSQVDRRTADSARPRRSRRYGDRELPARCVRPARPRAGAVAHGQLRHRFSRTAGLRIDRSRTCWTRCLGGSDRRAHGPVHRHGPQPAVDGDQPVLHTARSCLGVRSCLRGDVRDLCLERPRPHRWRTHRGAAGRGAVRRAGLQL